jgi:hypothetical protein
MADLFPLVCVDDVHRPISGLDDRGVWDFIYPGPGRDGRAGFVEEPYYVCLVSEGHRIPWRHAGFIGDLGRFAPGIAVEMGQPDRDVGMALVVTIY